MALGRHVHRRDEVACGQADGLAGMHQALRQDLEADAAAADQDVAGHLDAVEEGLDDGPPGAGERDRLLDGPGQVLAPPHPLHPALALGVGRLHDAGEDVPACRVAGAARRRKGTTPSARSSRKERSAALSSRRSMKAVS